MSKYENENFEENINICIWERRFKNLVDSNYIKEDIYYCNNENCQTGELGNIEWFHENIFYCVGEDCDISYCIECSRRDMIELNDEEDSGPVFKCIECNELTELKYTYLRYSPDYLEDSKVLFYERTLENLTDSIKKYISNSETINWLSYYEDNKIIIKSFDKKHGEKIIEVHPYNDFSYKELINNIDNIIN